MSGAQVSSFGNAAQNALFDPLMARRQTQYDTNDLLSQQTIGAQDTEMAARIAQSLVATGDEAKAAQMYPGMIAEAQGRGFLKNAPTVWPGMERARAVALLAVPVTEQYKTGQAATSGAAVADAYGFPGGAAPGPGAAAGGGGTASLTPFVARNLPPGITPEEDLLVRTASGEAADQGPVGQQAVAAVIRNRMRESGRSASDVIFAANQFEPWNNPATRAKLEAMDPNSREYQTILANIRANQADPTGGATHFYSPRAQQALGRQPPSWGNADVSAVIGGHNFYRIGYRPGGGAPVTPGQPQTPGGSTPPPGVQMGGAPPGPPGGAPGPYGGGGFGTALNPTAPTAPVARTPPAPGGGTASNVGGDVNAMLAGINRAQTTPMGGVMAAGPAAPTAPERQVASVELPPQPGWGTAVGSYGDGAAPAAPVPPPAATLPPGATAPPPPAAAMPAELQTDSHNLTARDRAELKPLADLARAGRIPAITFQNEVQQRQNANDVRKNHWETQQTAQQNAVATAAQRDLENRRNAAKDKAAEIEAAKLEQSKGEDADHLRVLQAFGPRLVRGEKLTDAEENQYDLHRRAYAEGPLQRVPDGKGGEFTARVGREVSDRFPPLPGQKEYAGLKPIPGTEKQPDFAPANAMTAMLDIGEGNRKIVKALDQLEAYPGGVGPLRGSLPNVMSNWTDPVGVKVRAAIGDVQGHQYHTLAGAAQSAAESGRLRTFVAGQTDDAEASKTKLRSMLDSNRQTLLDHYRSFGPDAGGRRLRNIEEEILATIPEDAVERLKKEPDKAKEFDRKYGRGASKLALQNG